MNEQGTMLNIISILFLDESYGLNNLNKVFNVLWGSMGKLVWPCIFTYGLGGQKSLLDLNVKIKGGLLHLTLNRLQVSLLISHHSELLPVFTVSFGNACNWQVYTSVQLLLLCFILSHFLPYCFVFCGCVSANWPSKSRRKPKQIDIIMVFGFN